MAPACEIHNHYGPTETTVGVLTYRSARSWRRRSRARCRSAGRCRTVASTFSTAAGRPVPAGEEGELVIGGAGVARGYLEPARADRRAVRRRSFLAGARRSHVSHRRPRAPAARRQHRVLRAHRHQVKLHGHRVELGEIEAALREHGGVRDAVVLARADASGAKATWWPMSCRSGQTSPCGAMRRSTCFPTAPRWRISTGAKPTTSTRRFSSCRRTGGTASRMHGKAIASSTRAPTSGFSRCLRAAWRTACAYSPSSRIPRHSPA
jgi:acyl-CoA synthetase (AMP-forming)/AMP-acid ligase II